MNKDTTITLTEEDVNAAVKNYIESKLGPNEMVKDITYFTGVRGDYDRGTAVEYVKEFYIEILENRLAKAKE